MARLAYLGSPAAAVPPLRALVDAGHDVAVVVSQPDRRRGRGGALVPSPVKAAAVELGIPTTDRVDDVIDAGVELGVVVAFGKLIRPDVLDAVPMVNLHLSLLPRWRGAAPVERAILAGDPVTGVCLMSLDEGLDTGPVLAHAEVAIGEDESADELRERLVTAGIDLLLPAVADGVSSLPPAQAQVGEPTYAAKIEPGEREIRWDEPAIAVHRRVRAGGAWTSVAGRRLKVHRTRVAADGAEPASTVAGRPGLLSERDAFVGCGEGAVELVMVQPEGKPAVAASAWRNGARLAPGTVMGATA